MGLFNLFKKNKPSETTIKKETIPDSEKKYYQPDSYYTDVAFAGTQFEKKVITFEERKKTAIPSQRGLYPAEILLLEYCSYGTYPGPKNGYPGFWWFEYGIRDVGAALKSLENRGYISYESVKDCVDSLTIAQLKEMLTAKGLPTGGKKAELIERIVDVASEEELIAAGVQVKYILTEAGRQELSENEYVPYMHKTHKKTTEDAQWGMTFNVWSINRLLGTGDKSNWKTVVEEQETKKNKETAERNRIAMEETKKSNPDLFAKLNTQDQQLEDIQKARRAFDENKDMNSYILFWEMLWKNGGLTFNGSKWHFELPDLYIAAERYDDALAFVKKLKKAKSEYADKADYYVEKIEKLKAKQERKKK